MPCVHGIIIVTAQRIIKEQKRIEGVEIWQSGGEEGETVS